jgi:hypothetical protein
MVNFSSYLYHNLQQVFHGAAVAHVADMGNRCCSWLARVTSRKLSLTSHLHAAWYRLQARLALPLCMMDSQLGAMVASYNGTESITSTQQRPGQPIKVPINNCLCSESTMPCDDGAPHKP